MEILKRSTETLCRSTKNSLVVLLFGLLALQLWSQKIPSRTSIRDLPFEEIDKRLKEKQVSFGRGRVLEVINILLLSDFTEEQKTTFKLYKLQELVETELYDEALTLANELLLPIDKDPQIEVKVLLERTLIFEIIEEMPASKKDLNRIQRLYDTVLSKENSEDYGKFLCRLASWYRVNDRVLEASQKANDALDYGLKNKFPDVAATAYLVLSLLQSSAKDGDRQELMKKGLNLWRQENREPGMVNMYYLLSKSYYTQNNMKEAMAYNDSALNLITENKTKYNRPNISEQRSAIFESLGQKDSALFYQKDYASESIKALKKSRDIKTKELEYELQREMTVLENVKLETKLSEASRKESYFVIGLLAAGVFLLSLGFLIITLASRNKRIKDQNHEITATNSDLSKTVEEKEFLLQEVNHRVKNNLSFIQSLIAFQLDDARTTETKSNLQNLNNRIHAVAVLHDQFVNAKNSVSKKDIEIAPYIETIADAQIISRDRSIEFKNSLNDIKVDLETAVPLGMLVNELLSNSMKHSTPPKDRLIIDLSMVELEDGYHIIYQDNGLTYDDDPSQTGLGTYIIKTMVRQLRGTMQRNGSMYSIFTKKVAA